MADPSSSYSCIRSSRGLVLTCVSSFPSPLTCRKVHTSEQAAKEHAARLESLLENVDNWERWKGREGSVKRRSPWRPTWVFPSMLGETGADERQEDENAGEGVAEPQGAGQALPE